MVDFNNDGIKDLLLGERYGTVYLFIRDSEGKLYNKGALPGVDVHKNSAPAVIDWNNDGILDMLVGEESTNSSAAPLHVYVNSGTSNEPNFIRKTVLLTANVDWIYHFRGHPQLADLDGDGLTDLIVGDEDGHVYFHKNVGSNISPSYMQEIETGVKRPSKAKPSITDWNEDGVLDMVVGDADFNVHLYMGSDEAVGKEIDSKLIVQNKNEMFFTNNSILVRFKNAEKNSGTIMIYECNGKQILSQSFRSFANEFSFEIPNLSKGLYIINLSINGSSLSKRLVIQ